VPHELAVQLPEHLPLPSLAHSLVAQVLLVESVHVPAPLHTEAVTTSPSVQVAGVQIASSPGNAQALPSLPSHCPLHTPLPPQAGRGPTGSPWMTLHVPTEPGSLHDSHWPSHWVSQHTPSTQKPSGH